ncbi:hypothetical protein ACEPAF_9562 [Sanghuangporus sanghuang]
MPGRTLVLGHANPPHTLFPPHNYPICAHAHAARDAQFFLSGKRPMRPAGVRVGCSPPQGTPDPLGLRPLGVAVHQDGTLDGCRRILIGSSFDISSKRAIGLPESDSKSNSDSDNTATSLMPCRFRDTARNPVTPISGARAVLCEDDYQRRACRSQKREVLRELYII